MGLMKEKLEAVMNEWEKGDEIQTNKEVPLSKKIIDYVLKNQNCTTLQITDHIMRTYPDTIKANISSILKQLSDRNRLEREDYFDKVAHRQSYKYRAPSETRRQELEAVRKAEDKASKERLEKMRKLAEMARTAKAAKKEERLKAEQDMADAMGEELSIAFHREQLKAQPHEGTGIRETLPAPKRHSAQEILDSLSVMQARELYDELKNIFGG